MKVTRLKKNMRFKCVGRASSGGDDGGATGCGHEWTEKSLGPAPPHQVKAGVHGYEIRSCVCPKCDGIYVWWMNAEMWDGPQRIDDRQKNRRARPRPRWGRRAKSARK